MGAHLHIGFITEASREFRNCDNKEELHKNAREFYPEDTFHLIEENQSLTFKLHNEIIQAELIPFIQEVYQDFHHSEPYFMDYFPKITELIKGLVTDQDWLQKVQEADIEEFRVFDYEFDDRFPFEGGYAIFRTQLIRLGYEGKFAMEESEKTLGFMEICAQKAYSHFKLGKCFRVVIL